MDSTLTAPPEPLKLESERNFSRQVLGTLASRRQSDVQAGHGDGGGVTARAVPEEAPRLADAELA